MSALHRGVGRHGIANRNVAIGLIRSLRSAGKQPFPDSAADEVFRFLDAYGVLHQSGNDQHWFLDQLRMNELQIACDNGKPLEYGFKITNIPGEACGCPQVQKEGASADRSQASAIGKGAASPKPIRVWRVAYVTPLEHHAAEVIHACQTDTVVGEFRSPVYMDNTQFAKSEFGRLFSYGQNSDLARDQFSLALDRFVAAGIIEIRKATGPEGVFDALVFTVPFDEIHFVRIPERKVATVPGFILNIVARVVAMEGITSFSISLAATIRGSIIARFKGHGVRQPEIVADELVALMLRRDTTDSKLGWGLLVEGHKSGEVLVCYPGLGPVQLVPEGAIMRGIIAREKTAPAHQAPPAPPRLLTVADIPGMDDDQLAKATLHAVALTEALQAEGPRRIEVRRKADLKANLERRIAEKRAETDSLAAEAERIAEVARLGREVADATKAEKDTLEAELPEMS